VDKWAFTSSKARGKHGLGLTCDAECLCQMLGMPVVDRANRGIPWLLEQHQLTGLLVEEADSLVAHWRDGGQLAFHPGMAVPRIKQLKQGAVEMLCQVMALQPGDSVLDCTMGMANDALVAAFAVGAAGRVTALESSPVVYAVTSYGLRHWKTGGWRLEEAMARIAPYWCDYHSYLPQVQPGQYAVIYFDPMFERPVLRSSGIAPLRRVADYRAITQDVLEEARRLAGRRVVVKHRAGTLQSLHFDAIVGGKYSTLAYGILYSRS